MMTMYHFLKYMIAVALVAMFFQKGNTQPQIGVEVSYSRFKTYNTAELIGSGGLSSYIVDREGDALSNTFTLSFLYKITDRHIVKLAFGRHQNGRVLDVSLYDDTQGIYAQWEGVDRPYNYFQISPRYTYRLIFGNLIVPLELGFNINKRINVYDIAYVMINKFNYDLRLSTGIQYRFIQNMVAGISAVYHHGLNEYQYDPWENGIFKPRQIGIEFSIVAEIVK